MKLIRPLSLRQMKLKAVLQLAVVAALGLTGCVHDPLDILIDPAIIYHDQPCSLDTVYFQQDILPILRSTCAQTGCHDVATAENDVILTSYSHLMNNDEDLVLPGNPFDSKLIEVMLENNIDDIMPPPPAAALDQSVIDLMILWIEQGATNWSCESCDTTDVTYTSHIAPLMSARCNSCHGGATPQNGLDLGTIEAVISSINYSFLMEAVRSQPGVEQMPPLTGLASCDVRVLEIWIENGMPE